MKTAVIRQRVADFLKQHPPFDAMPESDLLALAGSGRVKFHEGDEFVFQRGERPGPMLFVIQQGRVDLLDEGDKLRDVLGAGDLLGFDRLPVGGHRYWARTTGDVILYAIDRALFASVMKGSSVSTQRSSWLDLPAPPRSGRDTRTAVREMLAGSDTACAAELALFCDHNPIALRDRIRLARDAADLGALLGCARRYVVDALGGPADVEDAALLGGVFTRAAVEAAARIAAEELRAAGMDAPACRHSWLAFGAASRGEMLLPMLPNLAVVYDGSGEDTSLWFAALAGQTIGCLSDAGLHGPGLNWPDGAQPSMPIAEWKRFYSETIADPIRRGLYERRGFFDMSVIGGEELGELRSHLSAALLTNPFAIELLANDTLSHLPPLTLFRGLVLQLDGAESDRFDLRETIIEPIADAARVFELSEGGDHEGTLARLSHAGSDAVFTQAAAALRSALYFEALAGGPVVTAAQFERSDQRVLKDAFGAVQQLLEHTISRFSA